MRKEIVDLMKKPMERFFARANRVNVKIAECATPLYTIQTQVGPVTLSCPNSLTLWRAKTMLDKEPETLSWIQSFAKGDVLFDVGANIGLYSIYAAKHGCRVLAFEPESQNYALLNQNIYLNSMQDNVTAYNVALNDGQRIDHLYISQMLAGSALHAFGKSVDYNKQEFKPAFKQGVVSYSLDRLVEEMGECPTHIKIDVDGAEASIIAGARKVLSNPKLKSVLIELNTQLKEDMDILKVMSECGLEQVKKSHAPIFDDSVYRDIYNFIFVRKVIH